MGKKLLAENISRTGVCVCVMTRWEPGVRQESFIQGVKIANLVRKSAAADPFLS